MIIDFHSHSNASDGEFDPVHLVDRAIAAGVTRFAITDHDTLSGYRTARTYVDQLETDLVLYSGTELSCRWGGSTIHVLGLGIDPEHGQLLAGLEQLGLAREERAGTIAGRLDKAGFSGAMAGARELAGASHICRPHFARWMVAQGHAKDVGQAFDKYLGQGRLGDVSALWPELEQVTAWLREAGGYAVLAHPLKYRFTRTKLRRLLTDFVEAGGNGLEVLSGRQMHCDIESLVALAEEFGLYTSAGSDFHREWQYGPSLGIDAQSLPGNSRLWCAGAAP
jgi:predicted metal-dependent phosphoesterase TrpH